MSGVTMGRLNLIAVLCLHIVGGCTPRTDSIEASFGVVARETQITVEAVFRNDDLDSNEIGDVRATFRGMTIELKHELRNTQRHQWHSATLDLSTPVAADEVITVSVERDGETDAPSSSVTAPPPLNLTLPPLFISRSADLELEWSPITPDEMSWSTAEGSCVEGSGSIGGNVGSATIPKGTLKVASGFDDQDWSPRSCTGRLALRRTRTGPVDPAFASGSITFHQEATFEFASTW